MGVSINATIADNVKVDVETIRITIKRKTGEEFVEIENGQMERIGKNRYAYILSDIDQGLHEYIIAAEDVNDHKASLSGTFYVY